MTEQNYLVIPTADLLPMAFKEVFNYWRAQSGSNFAPGWANFHLDQLPYPLLPWAVVVDVETEPIDYYYRYWGSSRANLIGTEMTGKRTSEIPNEYMRVQNIQEYSTVCQKRTALLCQTPVVKKNGLHVIFQSIRLPLSDDGVSVTKIFSAMNYSEITKDHHQIYGTENSRNLR